MASFRKRAGRWQARIHRHGSTPIVKTFDLKADAERWAVAVQREIDLGSFAPRNEAENTTVSQLIDRYLLEVVPSFKGAERERYALKNIARFLGAASSSRPTSLTSRNTSRPLLGASAKQDPHPKQGRRTPAPKAKVKRQRSNLKSMRRVTRPYSTCNATVQSMTSLQSMTTPMLSKTLTCPEAEGVADKYSPLIQPGGTPSTRLSVPVPL